MKTDGEEEEQFSTDYCNPKTGYTLPRLTPKHFSFNSHYGACPACHGIGTQPAIDPDLLVDPQKSLEEGAVRPWRTGNRRMVTYYEGLRDSLARAYGVSLEEKMGKPATGIPRCGAVRDRGPAD